MNTDHEIWECIRAGDEQAFAKMFYRYSSLIYSRSFSFLKDPEACEQVVHDVFLTLWTNRNTLDIASFKAYLTSASRYRVYKHLTAKSRSPLNYTEDLADYSDAHGYYSTTNAALTNLACEEIDTEVNSHLKALPKRCQEIFTLSRRESLSNDEIAEQLGISKRTVENQLTYALRHLRLSLKDISVSMIILEGLNRFL